MSNTIDNRDILQLFFSGEEHHVRDIARRCKIHPTTASTHLESLTRKGMLTKRTIINAKVYAPNDANPDFVFEKRISNLRRIRQSGLLDILDKRLAYPTVILFGSWAKGENRKGSDIDIFVISDEKKIVDLSACEKELGEIQILLHTPEEFRILRKKSRELMNNVLNGIILSGRLEAY